MGFDQFDTVAQLIRERSSWCEWYKKYSFYPNAFPINENAPAPSNQGLLGKRGGKVSLYCLISVIVLILNVFFSYFQAKKRNDRKAAERNESTPNVVKQLLTDPAGLEVARQEELMAAATRTRVAASDAYFRSLSASVSKPSRMEEYPFVFDAMADLLSTHSISDRSKVSSKRFLQFGGY